MYCILSQFVGSTNRYKRWSLATGILPVILEAKELVTWHADGLE